jgi:hypothetical protein
MSPEITSALVGLALTVIGALAAYVRRVENELKSNTEITRQVARHTNGTMTTLSARLRAETEVALALRTIVRDREDRIAFLVARVPGAAAALADYRPRRADTVEPVAEAAALRAVAGGE